MKELGDLLGFQANIKFTKTTISINGKKFVVPKGDDTGKVIKFDDKVQDALKEIIPQAKANKLNKDYSDLINKVRKLKTVSTSWIDWHPRAPQQIKSALKDAKELVSALEEIIDKDILRKYELWRSIVDRGYSFLVKNLN